MSRIERRGGSGGGVSRGRGSGREKEMSEGGAWIEARVCMLEFGIGRVMGIVVGVGIMRSDGIREMISMEGEVGMIEEELSIARL